MNNYNNIFGIPTIVSTFIAHDIYTLPPIFVDEKPNYQSPPFIPDSNYEGYYGKPTAYPTRGGESLTKIVQVIDPVTGDPLVSAHITPQNTITDGNGEATITVSHENEIVNISFAGRVTRTAKFKDLGDLISLDIATLDTVIIKPTTRPQTRPTSKPEVKKESHLVRNVLFALGGIFVLSKIVSKSKPKRKTGPRKKSKKTVKV